ncbi:NAD-dependent epimerase/dehydratase family protein [Candidatus Dojkabacteria bacterium]|jgi:UDP-glucuronate 4-epimerase|nr:NAD-dependent epimerase/dehydratase family protein [Candidatus Dojkabacteria bacterium]
MRYFITGFRGYIGKNLWRSLAKDKKIELSGYDIKSTYLGVPEDILDFQLLLKRITDFNPDLVIHLAALTGVQGSLNNPSSYIRTNVEGTVNVFEACRLAGVKKIIYASSSSVYGNDAFSMSEHPANQLSIYAVSKASSELVADTYNNLYKIKSIGLRFFTVYGKEGRKDMAIPIFTEAIKNKKSIHIYGNQKRDFTYIDDAIQGIMLSIEHIDKIDEPQIYNISGGNEPIEMLKVVQLLEKKLGKKTKVIINKARLGDVEQTWGDISKAREELGYNPKGGWIK